MKDTAVEFLYKQLKARPGELTLLTIGPLTNIARLLKEHPDCKPWIKRLVMMGGSVRVGYQGKAPPDVEWNIKCDIKAAQTVFASGIPLVVAPLDATTMLKLEEPLRRRLFKAETLLSYQIQAMYQMWNEPTPTLFDPVAVALCFDERFCTMEDLRLTVDDKGMTRAVKGAANARVATAIRGDEFLKWYVDRVASAGRAARPKPPRNRTSPVERGGLPARVHAFEDFETDIEKRWWMSGKVETANVPPGSRARLSRHLDAGLRRPHGRHEDDVYRRHLQSGARPADGREDAPPFPLLAQGHRYAARADLQSDEGLSSLSGPDGIAARTMAGGDRGHDAVPAARWQRRPVVGG